MMSESREDQVAALIKKWTEGFEKDLSDAEARKDYLSIFNPDIVWTDHAFHVQRHGREAVIGLQKAFTHCNQPFRTDIKAIHHTKTGAVVETVWVGRCANDIVRPNGDVVVKAHGKEFANHVCFVFEFDSELRVAKIDEYYNKIWEDGVAEDRYHRIDGPSMKQ